MSGLIFEQIDGRLTISEKGKPQVATYQALAVSVMCPGRDLNPVQRLDAPGDRRTGKKRANASPGRLSGGVAHCGGLRKIATDCNQVDGRLTKIRIFVGNTQRYGEDYSDALRPSGCEGEVGDPAPFRGRSGSHIQVA